MNQLQPNSQTGFLESKSPNSFTFDSAKKVAFLELANKFADQEEAPNLNQICKTIGIGLRTFYDHIEADYEFKQGWEEVLLKIEDGLQRSLIRSGMKGAQGTTAAIFWLKNRFNKRWNDGTGQSSQDLASIKNALGLNTGFIDAEIVEPKQLPTEKKE